MSDVLIPNIAQPGSGTDSGFALWLMTRACKKAGWKTMASSNGVAKDVSAVAANDKWGGNANPALDTYAGAGIAGTAAWILMERDSMIYIAINAAPTSGAYGQPIPGETVTQATSGAEGEYYGHVFDPVSNTGWINIIPHTGVWDHTHTITGAWSGATFPGANLLASLKTYTQQFVIQRLASNNVHLSVSYQCIDKVNESAQDFNTKAADGTCTSTVAPGFAAAGVNVPSTRQIMVIGTPGVVPAELGLFSATGFVGNCQAMAKNATPGAGVSPDGSFAIMATNSGLANSQCVLGFFRMDDGELGDTDPYVWLTNSGTAIGSQSQGAAMTGVGATAYITSGILLGQTDIAWVGYNGVGQSGSQPADFIGGVPLGPSSIPPVSTGYPTKQTMFNTPAATKPIPRMRPLIFGTTVTVPVTKGRPRWISLYQKGNPGDLVGGLKWIIVAPDTSASAPAVALGMWDGSTVPTL